MKNEITLKGDTLSQLDFNLAPQDIVLNCSDGQVEANSLLLAVISPFIRQLLQEGRSSGPDGECRSCVDKTYISVPGLLSREVGSFLRSLVNGGEDVFVGEDLRRAFYMQAAFKATRLGETSTTRKITRLGEGKLEEPKTEVPVKEEIYDEEEVDENEGFEDFKSQTEGFMCSLKDPDTGRTYWQCTECDYHNKSAKSSKYKVERHVMRHHVGKPKPIRREEEMMMGSLMDTTTSRIITDELSDDEKISFLEDADSGENFEMNDPEQECPVAYHPTTSSHVIGAEYSCETCGKCFKTRKERKKHSLRHNDVRYPCETCGKDFSTPRDLRKHIARHLNKKNKKQILCPVCARSVTSEFHLKLHMRTHDKLILKYAECEFCGAKLRETCIKQHQQLCNATEEERAAFKAAQQKSCETCGKMLSNNSKLKRHMKTHETHEIAARYN